MKSFEQIVDAAQSALDNFRQAVHVVFQALGRLGATSAARVTAHRERLDAMLKKEAVRRRRKSARLIEHHGNHVLQVGPIIRFHVSVSAPIVSVLFGFNLLRQ